jgi:hypothetical protein
MKTKHPEFEYGMGEKRAVGDGGGSRAEEKGAKNTGSAIREGSQQPGLRKPNLTLACHVK